MAQLSKLFKNNNSIGTKKFNGLASLGGYNIPIKTNVLSNPMPLSVYSGNSNSWFDFPDRSIHTFYSTIEDARKYESQLFITNLMRIITYPIKNLIDKERNICEVKNKEVTDLVNKMLTVNNVKDLIDASIDDIIYYGSITYLLQRYDVKGTRYLKYYDIKHPYSTIIRNKSGEIDYIIKGEEDQVFESKNILYLGPANFKLLTPNEDFVNINEEFPNLEPVLASDIRYLASKPLIYSIGNKLKVYVLKDMLSTLISIKNAIEQTFFTLDMDISRNGSLTQSFNDMAQSIESLINRSTDESILLGDVLSIDVLVNRVISSVRVLPDPGGSLAKLNQLNLEPLLNKLNGLKEGISEIKDEILESIGIPKELLEGGSSAYEIMQKNERFLQIIETYSSNIKDSVINIVLNYCNIILPELKIKKEDIKLTYFRKSLVEYNRSQREMQILDDTNSSIFKVLDTAVQTIDSNNFINKETYFEYIRNAMIAINPDLGELLVKKLPSMNEGFGDQFIEDSNN